jgi:hypothetical protein
VALIFVAVIPKIFYKKESLISSQDAPAVDDKPRRGSFFKNLFLKDRSPSDKAAQTGQAGMMNEGSEPRACSLINAEYPEICYEDVLAGRFEAEAVDLDRIERYLPWEDCITYLGVTKDQLALMRSASIEAKKRPAFLTRAQLRIWPANIGI